jgi:predicted oxidoreductase (fatty acid repression mutant protein)
MGDHSLYCDQLTLTERHLDSLIKDANSSLQMLKNLSNSFKSVEDQTSSFQAQCEHLLTEQKRLEVLADGVGTSLHYYEYIDNVTRRLNAPGATRLVDHDSFADILDNLESCISFMSKNVQTQCTP